MYSSVGSGVKAKTQGQPGGAFLPNVDVSASGKGGQTEFQRYQGMLNAQSAKDKISNILSNKIAHCLNNSKRLKLS